MKKYFILILVIFPAFSYAQELTKIDANLSVQFPIPIDTATEDGVKIFQASFEELVLRVLVLNPEKKITTKKQYENSLKGLVDGYKKSEVIKSHRKKVSDTLIGGATGRMIYSSEPVASEFSEVYSFFTIRNNKMYLIEAAMASADETVLQTVKQFFSSATFYGEPYGTSTNTQSDEDSMAYNLGRLLGYIITFGFFGWVVYFLFKRIFKR